MPPRPTQGADPDNWGQKLNDWLDVGHNVDGTNKDVGGTFAGGTITGPTTVQTPNAAADQFVIREVNSETGYAMLVYGPTDLTVNTEHRWFMLHSEGGMCLSSAYEPNWGILHLYKWGAAQSKPLLRITNELTAGPDDLLVVDQNGGLILTPKVDFVDPFRVYDYLGNLLFEVARDGTLPGAPPIIDAGVLLNPKTVVGSWNRNVVNLFRFPYYMWNGNPPDHIDFDVGLYAGSWYLDTYVVGGNDQGKANVTLNGVSLGSVDAYSAGASPLDTVVTLGPFTVAAAGRKTLSYITTAKNPSSGAGNFPLRHAVFRRA